MADFMIVTPGWYSDVQAARVWYADEAINLDNVDSVSKDRVGTKVVFNSGTAMSVRQPIADFVRGDHDRST